MLGLGTKKKVVYKMTDPTRTIPKAMMPGSNRHERRKMAKFQRNQTNNLRVAKARDVEYREKKRRDEAHETRLEKVRAATKARKGQVNNPRFR